MAQDSSNPRGPGRRSYRQYLSRRRHEAHDEATAEVRAADRPDIPDHPLVCPDPPILVTDAAAMDAALAHLADQPAVAYDTEFIGETHYRPDLCLVQLATADRVYVIDPKAGRHNHEGHVLDLEPLWRMLADASIEKIVHAGEPDLEPIVRHIDAAPANVFDTQIATGFVGDDYPMSLHKLIAHYLDLELPKAVTFTRWDQRPLSKVHLQYAADDVRYLPALREAIGRRLDETDRTEWARAEFADLCRAELYRFDADAVVHRLRKTYALANRNAVLLKKFVSMRDQIAQGRDLPPRSVLKDRALVELARRAPEDAQQLEQVDAVPASFRSTHRKAILRTVKRATQSKAWAQAPPRSRPLTDRQRQRVDDLWAQVKQMCEEQRVAIGIVTNRHEFTELAKLAIRHRDVSPDHVLLGGWRRQLLQPVLAELGLPAGAVDPAESSPA